MTTIFLFEMNVELRAMIYLRNLESLRGVRSADLADALGITVRAMSQGLRVRGKTFTELLDAERRWRCDSVMANGARISLKELSRICGFSDRGSMYKSFKRWRKMSVTDYRREKEPCVVEAVTNYLRELDTMAKAKLAFAVKGTGVNRSTLVDRLRDNNTSWSRLLDAERRHRVDQAIRDNPGITQAAAAGRICTASETLAACVDRWAGENFADYKENVLRNNSAQIEGLK